MNSSAKEFVPAGFGGGAMEPSKADTSKFDNAMQSAATAGGLEYIEFKEAGVS